MCVSLLVPLYSVCLSVCVISNQSTSKNHVIRVKASVNLIICCIKQTAKCCKCCHGFIQALLLTSTFHEGLCFMLIGPNPMYVSMLPLQLGVPMGCCKLVASRGNDPGSFGFFTNPRLSNSLSIHHSVA